MTTHITLDTRVEQSQSDRQAEDSKPKTPTTSAAQHCRASSAPEVGVLCRDALSRLEVRALDDSVRRGPPAWKRPPRVARENQHRDVTAHLRVQVKRL